MAVTINLVVAAPGVAPAFAATPRQAPAATPIAMGTTHPSREVFGFALASSLSDPTIGYPSWRFDLLTTVAYFGLHVNSDGGFVGDSGWSTWNSSAFTSFLSVAHEHGTRVLLTIILQDFSPNTPTMCAGLSHYANTVAATLIEVKARGVDGVNIDYEGLNGSCGTPDANYAQHAMTNFVQKMRAGLGSSYYLSVDTYASSAVDGYGFFDPNGMKTYVDSFFVMAYDLEYSNYHYSPVSCSRFCLGPTSPLSAYYYNDASIGAQYVSLVGASKVVLGVPYYGRKACVGSAVANAYPTSSIVADSYLDAVGEASYYETKPGSYVVHREERSAGMERWDTWYNTTLGCTRELYFDDAVSLGKKYDLVNTDNLRGVGIWTLNYGGGAPELWTALATHFGGCASVDTTAGPVSPQAPASVITWTATSTGCPNPRYRFWELDPGRRWSMVQDYSVSNTYSWHSPAIAGNYEFEVDVRDASESTVYDVVVNKFYVLKGTPVCTAATLSVSPASPGATGVAVTMTGGSSTCPNPRYRFWVSDPGSRWSMVQDYSAANTHVWAQTFWPGVYRMEVDVRDASETTAYDVVYNTTYTLDGCTGATISGSPASAVHGAGPIVLTATATCPGTPTYRFWVEDPGNRWSMVQDFSTKATFTWPRANQPAAGVYRIEVDVRDQGSQAVYEYATAGHTYTMK